MANDPLPNPIHTHGFETRGFDQSRGLDISFPDPVTSWALAIKAIAEMITEIVRGQPQDVKTKMWQRFIETDDRMRRFFHIDDPPK